MGKLQVIYWLAFVCSIYPYVVYPLILAIQARLKPRPTLLGSASEGLPSVSVVVVAYNEAGRIGGRVLELAEQIRSLGLDGEIVVVSDGSTDRTAAIVEAIDGLGVPIRLIALSRNVGKAAALTEGCRAAENEILALADVRQTWAPDALARLLENFHDPAVGAVSGELFVRDSGGAMAAVGLYWRFEKWLRRNESRVYSTVGLTGAICAVRHELFEPIPIGIILDDVYWPLRVVMNQRRVIFDGRAHTFDVLPDNLGSELHRKVRTLSGNFQLVAAMPEVLLPGKNPVWFALISHKLMRLAVPWTAPVFIVIGPIIGGVVPLGTSIAAMVIVAMGIAGLAPVLASRSRLVAASTSFLALNFAAWMGFWVWVSGRANRSWTKVRYRDESEIAINTHESLEWVKQ